MSYKVAVASSDGKVINQHFGRSIQLKLLTRASGALMSLPGLIWATAILRPGKSLDDLSVQSVKKKWKQKNFAVAVNREVMEEGAGMLGDGTG